MSPLAGRCDVIIVGGGVIGCACACSLAHRGLSVVLLERETLAAGASGACDGHLTVQTKAAGLHARLAADSLTLYRSLPADFREATGLRECGSLLVAHTEGEAEALEKLSVLRQQDGLDVRLLRGTEARALEPALTESLVCASHCPTDAQANPWRICQWFARSAERHGAAVIRGADVRRVLPAAGGVRVLASCGGFEGQSVVLCAGVWSPELCRDWLPLPVVPRRGEVLVTERLPRLLNGLVISAGYLARKFGDEPDSATGLAVEQTEAGNVLIGGTRDFAGMDRSVSADGMTALAAAAVRLVPALAHANVIRAFAGLRPYMPDGLPVIGPLPDCPCIILATGHEGDGITLAPITARLVADYITEGCLPDASLLPHRLAQQVGASPPPS